VTAPISHATVRRRKLRQESGGAGGFLAVVILLANRGYHGHRTLKMHADCGADRVRN
jgi:hypothetical protein